MPRAPRLPVSRRAPRPPHLVRPAPEPVYYYYYPSNGLSGGAAGAVALFFLFIIGFGLLMADLAIRTLEFAARELTIAALGLAAYAASQPPGQLTTGLSAGLLAAGCVFGVRRRRARLARPAQTASTASDRGGETRVGAVPDGAPPAEQPAVSVSSTEPRSEGGIPPTGPVCAKCGTALPDGANFCFQCGERMNPPELTQPDANTRTAPRAFAIANQRGHTGKTTTAIDLAACLAVAGRRTLVVDMSPGADATTGLGVDPHRVGLSTYELLVRDDTSLTDVLKADLRPNLALLPAKVDLYAADIELVSLDQREFRLKRIIESVKGDYDFVLIDCPSWLGILTINALTAADGVILPLPCEYFALEGMQQLLNTIRLVRDRLNPRVGLFGVVLTLYDPRTRLSAEVVDEITQHFPKEKFQTLIPRNIRLSEAPSFGLTILEHDARSPGALAYKNLAEEVIARAAMMEGDSRERTEA